MSGIKGKRGFRSLRDRVMNEDEEQNEEAESHEEIVYQLTEEDMVDETAAEGIENPINETPVTRVPVDEAPVDVAVEPETIPLEELLNDDYYNLDDFGQARLDNYINFLRKDVKDRLSEKLDDHQFIADLFEKNEFDFNSVYMNDEVYSQNIVFEKNNDGFIAKPELAGKYVDSAIYIQQEGNKYSIKLDVGLHGHVEKEVIVNEVASGESINDVEVSDVKLYSVNRGWKKSGFVKTENGVQSFDKLKDAKKAYTALTGEKLLWTDKGRNNFYEKALYIGEVALRLPFILGSEALTGFKYFYNNLASNEQKIVKWGGLTAALALIGGAGILYNAHFSNKNDVLVKEPQGVIKQAEDISKKNKNAYDNSQKQVAAMAKKSSNKETYDVSLEKIENKMADVEEKENYVPTVSSTSTAAPVTNVPNPASASAPAITPTAYTVVNHDLSKEEFKSAAKEGAIGIYKAVAGRDAFEEAKEAYIDFVDNNITKDQFKETSFYQFAEDILEVDLLDENVEKETYFAEHSIGKSKEVWNKISGNGINDILYMNDVNNGFDNYENLEMVVSNPADTSGIVNVNLDTNSSEESEAYKPAKVENNSTVIKSKANLNSKVSAKELVDKGVSYAKTGICNNNICVNKAYDYALTSVGDNFILSNGTIIYVDKGADGTLDSVAYNSKICELEDMTVNDQKDYQNSFIKTLKLVNERIDTINDVDSAVRDATEGFGGGGSNPVYRLVGDSRTYTLDGWVVDSF